MVDRNIRNGEEHYRHRMYNKVQAILDREAAIIMEREGVNINEAVELARERAICGEIDISNSKRHLHMNRCTIS